MSLLQGSMAGNSWRTYQGALQSLYTFLRAFRLPSSLPLLPADIALYLSYLHGKGYSPNTMATHVSAIAAVHKIAGVTDPTDTFLIQKVLQGARRARPQCDTRLPITFPILMKLVDSLPHICDSYWDRSLYRCMYLMAFFAFLRVGEMTTSSGAETNTLTLDSIHWTDGAPTMQVVFTSYKHARHPATITLQAQKLQPYCPLQAWKQYYSVRGPAPGFLFRRADGQPVARRDFTRQLSLSLQACQFSTSLYKAHSFRIGAATYAAGRGFSDAQIRSMGRWNSDAFKRYIRF